MTTKVWNNEYSNTYMTDKERYKYMTDHLRNGSPNNAFTISKTNYNFLLKAYDEKERLKAENKFLRNELKHYKGESV